MDSKRLLKHLVYLMFFIFIANLLAIKFHWYSLIWYFDIVMHILGGFWVGMFFLYVFKRKDFKPVDAHLFFKVFLASLVIGILWEFYEFYIYQHISQIPFNQFDTLTDIFFDLLGSSFAFLYFSKLIMLRSINRLQ